MKEKYIYPCVIYEEDGIFYANFKDFDACFTDGESIEEVIINAKDVLEGTIFSLLKNNLKVPEPTLTIPKWLNDEAEKHSVNFSNLLQTAIKKYLNIQEN